VTSQTSKKNDTVLENFRSIDSEDYFWWICSDLNQGEYFIYCDIDQALALGSGNWKLKGHPIDYCLSERVEEHCKLQFLVQVMAAVIICNLLKVLCMFLTVWKYKTETLVTVGDAIASFLDKPDPTTEGRCLSSKEDFVRGPWAWGRRSNWNAVRILSDSPGAPQVWNPSVQRWWRAASLKRWISTMTL
jgi:hypothetical protein